MASGNTDFTDTLPATTEITFQNRTVSTMNVPKLLRTAFLSVFCLLFAGGLMVAQAQTTFFVDATSGDDNNSGTSETEAFETISQAVSQISDGDTVVVLAANAPGYNNNHEGSGTITVANTVTFEARPKSGIDEVKVGGSGSGVSLEVDATGKTVTFQRSSSAFFEFENELDLNDGSVSLASAEAVQMADGSTLRRTAGSIDTTPTLNGSLTVTYDDATVTTGPELPADSDQDITLRTVTGGTVTLSQNTTVEILINIQTIDVGSNTLTLSSTNADASPRVHTNLGTVQGTGTLVTSGAEAHAFRAFDGTFGNVSLETSTDFLNRRGGATFTFTDLTIDAPSSATIGLTAGGSGNTNTIEVEGDFDREDGTVDATGGAGDRSILDFTGSVDGSFDPGLNLTLDNLTFSRSNATVSLERSVDIEGDLNVSSSTQTVALGTSRIRLEGDGATSTNDGTLTSTSDGTASGGITFRNSGSGNVGNLAGSGNYTNVTVSLPDGTADVLVDGTSVDVFFTGRLLLKSGGIKVDDSGMDPGDAPNFGPTGSSATIERDMSSADTDITVQDNGTFNVGGNSYDLTYSGNTGSGTRSIGSEFTTNVENLTVSASNQDGAANGGVPISGTPTLSDVTVSGELELGSNVTVDGALTVSAGGEVRDDGSSQTITLSSDGETHSVVGTANGGSNTVALDIDGDNVTLNGSTNGDRLARVGDLNVGDGTNEQSITVQDIQEIEGGVGIQNSADLTLGLVDTDDGGVEGEIQGTFGIRNGINFTSSSNGLTLTSDVEVTGGDLSASNGTLDLGGNTLEVSGGNDITLDSGLDYSAGGGTLVADGGSASLDFGGLDVENLRVEGSDATLASGVEVSGLLDVDADVDNDGNTITLSGDAELADDSPNLGGAGNETIRGSAALEVTGSASTITAETDVSFTNLEVNTGGTVDFRTNNDQAPRIFEISDAGGSFTHTQGGVSLGINDLRLAVQTSYSYSEGTYSTNATRFGIGEVVLDDSDGNADFESFNTNGNEVSIPDLTIQGSDDGYALQSSDDVLTVTGTLELERGTLNSTSNNGTVNIADGATIERNAGTLDEAPTFNSNVNVRYANRSGITSGVELPSSTDLLQTLTVEGGNEVALDKSVTVNSELSLLAGNFDVDDGGQDPRVITVVDGGTVSLGGGDLNNEDGEGSLAYNGTATLEYRNEQDINENSTPDVWPDEKTDVDLVIDGADLTIDTNDRTVASATFDTGGGDFDLDDSNSDARTLTVTGDITRESDDSGTGGFFSADNSNSSTVVLGGSSAQSIALPGLTEMTNVSLEMDNSEGATLSGGGLEVEGLFTLTSGVFDTGDAFIYLSGGDVSRSGGLVEGTVRHDIPSTGTAAEVLTFPLGSPEAGTYRPVTLTFDNPSNVGASGTIDADYVASGPGGANNLPLLTEDDNGNDLRIARYPDFHWTLETSTSIAPSVSYDIEAEAEGFSAFVDEDIANLRTIRRQVGSTSNQWRLLGDGPSDYNNFQSAEDYPHAVVSGVSGGLTSSGTIFSYGLESNLEAESIADQTVDEGETSTGPFLGSSATDEVDAVFDGGTGEYSYDVSSSNTDVATASAPDDTLVVEGQGAGTATITVELTDALNDTASVSAQVDVQGAPSFTDALPDTTVTEADTLTFTYQAEDPDGDDLGYELTESPDGASIDSTSGEFSWSPAFDQAGGSYNVVARVTDGGRTALSDTAVVTVEQSLAKGDVDGDQDTTTTDATAALSINLDSNLDGTGSVDGSDPTEAQEFAADFDGNGRVGANDASLILQAAAGLLSGNGSAAIASKSTPAAQGDVHLEGTEQDENAATLPIVLSEGAAGVQAVEISAEIDLSAASVADVSTDLPDDWIANYSVQKDGTVQIALAGSSPIGDGQIGAIRLETDGSSVEPEGQYRLNNGPEQTIDVRIAPEQFALKGNYPNPVGSSTTIEYSLKERVGVEISVYDALGRKVATPVNEQKPAGRFEATVDTRDLSSGVYFYRIEAGDFTETKKMTVVR